MHRGVNLTMLRGVNETMLTGKGSYLGFKVEEGQVQLLGRLIFLRILD